MGLIKKQDTETSPKEQFHKNEEKKINRETSLLQHFLKRVMLKREEKKWTFSGDYIVITFDILYRLIDIYLVNPDVSCDQLNSETARLLQQYFRLIRQQEEKFQTSLKQNVLMKLPLFKKWIDGQIKKRELKLKRFSDLIQKEHLLVQDEHNRISISVNLLLTESNIHLINQTISSTEYINAFKNAYSVLYQELVCMYQELFTVVGDEYMNEEAIQLVLSQNKWIVNSRTYIHSTTLQHQLTLSR